MLVKKTRKSIITGEYIYESTRCLATGEGCVNYQKDISELLKIPISNIKLDTTSVISKSAIQERNDVINNLKKEKESMSKNKKLTKRGDTKLRKRTRKALAMGACLTAGVASLAGEAFNIIALGITLGSLEPFDDGVLVVDPGTYARAAMDGCSSWWKRADYRW